MKDPEIRELQIATARAYAIAQRLAVELDSTVDALVEFTQTRATPQFHAPKEESRDEPY